MRLVALGLTCAVLLSVSTAAAQSVVRTRGQAVVYGEDDRIEAASAEGYQVMVGCMVGSSLAMAPAVLLAQGVAFTDLDGPLLLAEDRDEPLIFDEAGVHAPTAGLWGYRCALFI